ITLLKPNGGYAWHRNNSRTSFPCWQICHGTRSKKHKARAAIQRSQHCVSPGAKQRARRQNCLSSVIVVSLRAGFLKIAFCLFHCSTRKNSNKRLSVSPLNPEFSIVISINARSDPLI